MSKLAVRIIKNLGRERLNKDKVIINPEKSELQDHTK